MWSVLWLLLAALGAVGIFGGRFIYKLLKDFGEERKANSAVLKGFKDEITEGRIETNRVIAEHTSAIKELTKAITREK